MVEKTKALFFHIDINLNFTAHTTQRTTNITSIILFYLVLVCVSFSLYAFRWFVVDFIIYLINEL